MPSVQNQSRIGTMPDTGRTAFVFSGGAVHGAAQVGMLKRLIEAGIKPDVVVGSSAGAINAAAYADKPSLEGVNFLENVWLDLAENAPVSISLPQIANAVIRKRSSFDSGAGMRKLIMSNMDAETFEDLHVETHICTTSTETLGPVWWTQGPVQQIVLASAAIPGVLPSVLLPDGDQHIDGGMVDNVPVGYTSQLEGVTNMYVLDVTGTPRAQSQGAVPNLLDGLGAASTEIVRMHWAQVPHELSVVHIDLPHDVDGFTLDFSKVSEFVNDGWHACDIALERSADELLSCSSKVKLN